MAFIASYSLFHITPKETPKRKLRLEYNIGHYDTSPLRSSLPLSKRRLSPAKLRINTLTIRTVITNPKAFLSITFLYAFHIDLLHPPSTWSLHFSKQEDKVLDSHS